jgi:hypothetical protein
VNTPQSAIPGIPVAGNTPTAYISPGDAEARLNTRYVVTCGGAVQLDEGTLLIASMNLDEEAPFFGVKVDPTQDREWPRTFKSGWPNLLGGPSPIMVTNQLAGAFYLGYEGVVPEQVVDWVCLEAYRIVTLPFDRDVTSESALGASVHYARDPGSSQLDRMQAALLSPFMVRDAHTQPFVNFSS